jgi:hypothetical protein
MPEFSYEITKGQLIYDDPKARQKFLDKKPDGYRGFELHKKPKQSKTNPQVAYYWGLLVPQITLELVSIGWTTAVGAGDACFEREWNKDDTHFWLKENGARIGDSGEYVTLSDQDIEECSKFITNVLWICDKWLSMDVEKLKAKQPGIN